MIRIVERPCGAIERCIVKLPFWRSELPNELPKVMSVLVVSRMATFRGEIVLVPPLELGLRWQRHPTGSLAADQIAAHRHQGLAALRPQSSDDVRCPRSPVKASQDRLLNLESVHQSDDIQSDCRLLTVPKRRVLSASVRDF